MSDKNPEEVRSAQILFFFAVMTVVFMFLIGKAFAAEVKTVKLTDEKVARVGISTRGTVLSFPVKPSKVILSNQGAFGIEYVENDLAVTPLTPGGRSHLFVYLYGRRFNFDLVAEFGSNTALILVRDAFDEPERTKKPPNVSKPKQTATKLTR